jgi:hypothetical protein
MDDKSELIAAKVAAALRAPERADSTFPDRVMRAVQNEGSETTERSVVARIASRFPRPTISGLALAASLAAIALVGGRLLSERGDAPGTPRHAASARDTVHVVRFIFVAAGASSVALVGDFNQWDVNAHRLRPAGGNGVWSASVTLTPGRHEYAFVIDGTRWVADPSAPAAIADEFGGESSVVTVGELVRPRSS